MSYPLPQDNGQPFVPPSSSEPQPPYQPTPYDERFVSFARVISELDAVTSSPYAFNDHESPYAAFATRAPFALRSQPPYESPYESPYEPPVESPYRPPYEPPYESPVESPYAVPDAFPDVSSARLSASQRGPVSFLRDMRSQSTLQRPLRVIHVGQYMVRAGIESWLKSLVKYADPNVLEFKRCIVTSPLSDPRVMREMPVPVEVGGRESVRQAAQDCDVLLVSGPAEVATWLDGVRPPLCVGVAHGDAIWTRHILERCAPAFDHVVAVSRGVEARVCGGFRSTIIYNGVDLAHLSRTRPRDEMRARFGFVPGDYVVGSVMRLSSEKRPELLVQALAQLPRHVKLFLVGWGALRQKLLDLANDVAPMRCVIAPADSDLGDYYQTFDAFCLPSDSEGFGLATLEAQFCGLPVVTTRTGYAPELLTNGVHYLQCAGQVDSVAECLRRLEANRVWAAAVGGEGRRVAEQFGFARRMSGEYERLFVRLWNERNGAS